MTHGFKGDRLIADQGTINRSGAGEVIKYDNGTDNVQTFMSDGSPEGVHAADKGSFAHDYTNGCVYYKTTDTVNTGWIKAGANVPQAEMKQNLGFTYAAGSGTFTVRGSSASLSASNPAYVTLQSKSSPGDNVLYTITADQSFIDDNGTSEIVGNLFGLTTSVAWAQDIPFFLYAVGNDDEDTIAFMISRNPSAKISPAAASIGAPDDAVADSQTSFFSLENIDESLYDSNPCLCIGSFRMQMSASDDWTVQTLTSTDGIGLFQEGKYFTLPAGVNGAASGTYIKSNAGTEPQWATVSMRYMISRDGWCRFKFDANNCNVAGVGTEILQPILPYNISGTQEAVNHGIFIDDSAAEYRMINASGLSGTSYMNVLRSDSSTSNFTNDTIDSSDDLQIDFFYSAFTV